MSMITFVNNKPDAQKHSTVELYNSKDGRAANNTMESEGNELHGLCFIDRKIFRKARAEKCAGKFYEW